MVISTLLKKLKNYESFACISDRIITTIEACMDISKLSSASIKSLVHFLEKKEVLENELSKIENQIASIISGKQGGVAAAQPGRKAKVAKVARPIKVEKKGPKPSKSRASGGRRRGALKEAVLAEIKKAGSQGISAKELSSKLGVPNQNVHVWFSSTGKNVPGLSKNAAGRWVLK